MIKQKINIRMVNFILLVIFLFTLPVYAAEGISKKPINLVFQIGNYSGYNQTTFETYIENNLKPNLDASGYSLASYSVQQEYLDQKRITDFKKNIEQYNYAEADYHGQILNTPYVIIMYEDYDLNRGTLGLGKEVRIQIINLETGAYKMIYAPPEILSYDNSDYRFEASYNRSNLDDMYYKDDILYIEWEIRCRYENKKGRDRYETYEYTYTVNLKSLASSYVKGFSAPHYSTTILDNVKYDKYSYVNDEFTTTYCDVDYPMSGYNRVDVLLERLTWHSTFEYTAEQNIPSNSNDKYFIMFDNTTMNLYQSEEKYLRQLSDTVISKDASLFLMGTSTNESVLSDVIDKTEGGYASISNDFSTEFIKYLKEKDGLLNIPMALQVDLKAQNGNNLNAFIPNDNVLCYNIKTTNQHSDIMLELSLWDGSTQIGTKKNVNFDSSNGTVSNYDIEWNDINYYIDSSLVDHNKTYNLKIEAIDNLEPTNRDEIIHQVTVNKTPFTLNADLKVQGSNSLNSFIPNNNVMWYNLQTQYWHNDIRLELTMWDGLTQIGTMKTVNFDTTSGIYNDSTIDWNDIYYYVDSSKVSNKTYSMKIEVIDNLDSTKRAYVTTPITVNKNTPPVIQSIQVTPNIIWEGDSVRSEINIYDQDLEQLQLEVYIEKDGQTVWQQIKNYVSNGNNYEPIYIDLPNDLEHGDYILRAKVVDTHNEWFEDSINFTIETKDTSAVNCIEGQIYNLVITGEYINSQIGAEIIINYNPQYLEVQDLIAITPQEELSPINLAEYGIEIKEFNSVEGSIKLNITRDDLNGSLWLDILNSIKFRCLKTGITDIDVTINER